MSTADIAYFNDWTKEVFHPGVFDQKNMRAPTLDLFESGGPRKFPSIGLHEGKYLKVALDIGFNPNSGVPTGESGPLPTPGADKIDSALYTTAEHSSAFRISKRLMLTADGGGRSVVDAQRFLMKNELRTMRRMLNWYCHQDGSGEYARLASISGNTITFATGSDMTMIRVDAEIVVRHRTTGALLTSSTFQSAGKALVVLTVSGVTATVAWEDGTVPSLTLSDASAYGAYAFDSQGEAINGFAAVTAATNPDNWGSSSAYYGEIDRTTDPGKDYWIAQQIDAAVNSVNQILSIEDHVAPMLNLIDIASPDEEVMLLCFVRHEQWDTLAFQLMRNQVTAKSLKLQNKYDAIEWQNVVFVKDRDAPKDKARFIDQKAIGHYIIKPWGWDEETGAIWSREKHPVATGRPIRVYRADASTVRQMFARRVNTSGVIKNIRYSQ